METSPTDRFATDGRPAGRGLVAGLCAVAQPRDLRFLVLQGLPGFAQMRGCRLEVGMGDLAALDQREGVVAQLAREGLLQCACRPYRAVLSHSDETCMVTMEVTLGEPSGSS